MIHHIVLVKYKAEVTESQIAALWQELHAMEGKIEGLVKMTSGKSESPEKIERGYMHGFIAEFRDWDALERYQNHPDHKAFGAKLVAHAQGGIDGILVFDLPTSDGE